ncbi:MAG: Gfo/Idh/MocA family oxidoreductase [Chloroflexi bacterium]|nr:Gfo/Idh/MocA family oxidoreductase [Chloroflexota bacterium]
MVERERGVGIIGAGAFGAEHARALAEVSGLRLVAASARTPSRLGRFVAEHGGRGYPDYRDLLADPAVDVVCIALPHNDHVTATVAALQAGKAVMLEKPMAPTREDCDVIVRAVAETGQPLMVAHPYRFMSAYCEARRLIDEGAIGRPVVGSTAMVKDWTYEQREPWHLANGGGMWLTNGCHLVDRLCYLLGGLPRDVRAMVGTYFHPQEADDVGVGLLSFDNGAIGTIRAIGYRVGADDHATEIQGDAGALRVSHRDGVFLGKRGVWEPVFAGPSPLRSALQGEWEALLAHVRGEGPSPVTAEYGRAIVTAVLAGVESSATGQVVSVNTSSPVATAGVNAG